MLFTVFTPTYNRAHLLNRVYESLKKQTCKDFEWLIVDDGSTDGTDNLVAVWKQDPGTDFPIRYIWQKNGHKKTAFNRGVKEAAGALLLPWDSDDEAVPNALETFRLHWLNIPLQHRKDFVGVCGLSEDPFGKLVGDPFPAQVLDSDSLEVRYRYGVTGEKWGFSRTDVLRQYPFPEHIRGHVPEGIVWSAIARRYKRDLSIMCCGFITLQMTQLRSQENAEGIAKATVYGPPQFLTTSWTGLDFGLFGF